MKRGRSGSGNTADQQGGLSTHDCPGETVGHEPHRAHAVFMWPIPSTSKVAPILDTEI